MSGADIRTILFLLLVFAVVAGLAWWALLATVQRDRCASA